MAQKRTISFTAKNGDIDVKGKITLEFKGFSRDTVQDKTEMWKNSVYELFSGRYNHSEIKID